MFLCVYEAKLFTVWVLLQTGSEAAGALLI